ncbi:MAG TPA: DUF4381 domain-containing protein [Pseudomonadales bacterium]|nr:DUF4381 domain-containing protein [Pseudomonadales bacterium]
MPANNPVISTAPFNGNLGNATPTPGALAQLKPLIEPDAIRAWPPAPGWWVLGAILLACLIAAAVWGFRRWRWHRQTRYQREALSLLAMIQNDADSDTMKKLHDAAMVLRRATLCAWGREHTATLTWEAIFAKHNPRKKGAAKNSAEKIVDDSSVQLLMQSLYSQHAPSPAALQVVLAEIAAWVVTLPPVES